MRGVFVSLASLMLLPLNVSALELYCKGTTYYGGQEGKLATVFIYDEVKKHARISLPEGKMSGKLSMDEQRISGTLAAEHGVEFSVTVDRFDGTILVFRLPMQRVGGKATFFGECAKQARKF